MIIVTDHESKLYEGNKDINREEVDGVKYLEWGSQRMGDESQHLKGEKSRLRKCTGKDKDQESHKLRWATQKDQ